MRLALFSVPRFGPTASVWLLGLTQIIGYGTLYYCFGVLAGAIARSFGWSQSAVFAVLSLGFLVGGLAAPLAGSLIDRFGAPIVMAVGSVVSAGTLAMMSAASGPAIFVAGMLLAQIAVMSVQYEAAFSCLVQICGARARARINQLTLIAGLSSSLFWPLTAWLADWSGWRVTLLIFGAANLFICAPLHLALLGARDEPESARPDLSPKPEAVAPTILPASLQREALILTAAGFALGGFFLSGALALMVPMLASLGLGSTAVLVSTLFGPSQTFVRFGNLAFGQARHPIAGALAAAILIPLAGLVLAGTAPSLAGAVLFAVLLGFGSGLKSIMQGTLPLALFGTLSYAAKVSRIASARLALASAAPFVLAWLTEQIGARGALTLMALVGVLGLAAFLRVARLCRAHAA